MADSIPTATPTHSDESASESDSYHEHHWRERLKKLPLPSGARDSSDSDSDDKWFLQPHSPTRVSLWRRSKRLAEKNPSQHVLYPPYYGQEPPKKVRKLRAKPMLLPDYKKRMKEWEEKSKYLPPPPYFSPEEREEMRQDLVLRCTKPINPGLVLKGPSPGYIAVHSPHPDVDADRPQYPLLTKINEATVATLGMVLRREADGKMRACFPGS